jgi:acetylglutamate/LysW-gamma-L-alpha-aminoadipate kinase
MTLVIKIGGAAGVATERMLDELARYLATPGTDRRVVLVHGGSDLTNELARELGREVRTLTSPGGMTSRYTDHETLRIYAMAVAGQINTELVAQLQRRGINALGLAGVDGRLLLARRKAAIRALTPDGRVQIVRDDYTGQIEQVNAQLLNTLLAAGYLPVVAPLAVSSDGERLNVDGDRVAAAIAGALGAEELVIATNVPGLLRDPNDPSTLIPRIEAEQLEEYTSYAQGRMRKKILGAREAIAGGVRRVHIGSAPLDALLSGDGTTIEVDSREMRDDRASASGSPGVCTSAAALARMYACI